ncbi:hypothetical protein C5B42_03755 [Candidatus Cerribacteria bacterium 'Amazon FNV 2010 28 9']|uniref:Non-canonical purine NTP pyrophosphatase n=1 Tax=Candidatus Cerribacteria bacterium 'Amazon FNV 2010 28 9' TaxID=2081795 RepID=A0A317JPL6_9BACT|nr:MAG: hypothetical protein C5B42_03755 [Candidatus Cerribacteria bacterium 'Amazon FNV 2010 28 9']
MKHPLFTFITSNTEKIATAHMYLDPLGVQFEAQGLDLVEPQSHSIEEISRYKAQHAFDVLGKPVVVTDHGWFITALHGFPGAFMKYMNEWFTPQDFLNLISSYQDRTITKREVICYTDGKETKCFTQDFKGVVLDEPKGGGTSAMQIVSLSQSGKSVGECIDAGIDPTDGQHTLWRDLSEWLRHAK